MKKTTLRQHLSTIDLNREAITTPKGFIRYEELIENRWHGNKDASVIIFCADLEVTARALVALDGSVRAVCAIPVSLHSKDISSLLLQWCFDVVVTDQDLPENNVFLEKKLPCISISTALKRGPALEEVDIETKWLVPTSGTTSIPKLVVHTFRSLARIAIGGQKATEPPQAWAMLYDITRFAGYQVFFQALLSGHKLIFAGLDLPTADRVRFYAEHGVTHLSATPTLLRKILMSPVSVDLNPLQITLGGESADQTILNTLAAKYPQARITHIYASTEVGVSLSVSDGQAGFPLDYTEKSFNGVEIWLKANRLHIRSTKSPSVYAGGQQITDKAGWVNTGDLVRVDGARFFIIGRENGVINVGGDKVVPEQVRDVLLACDLVQEAVVYAKTNSFTGSLVVADVVLTDSKEVSKTARQEIEAFLSDRLTRQQCPRVLRFVSEINANAAGKVHANS